MNKFKVGDRIRVRGLNATGTVVRIMPKEFGENYKNWIDFDDKFLASCGYGDHELILLENAEKIQFLLNTSSNISYQLNKRVLELSKSGLKDYFNVDKVILSK